MDNYEGEIRIFPYNKVPRDWMPCEGQQLLVSSFASLFALMGNKYGGDGVVTFRLPDLRRLLLIGQDADRGFPLGTIQGQESVQISPQQMPHHTPTMKVCSGKGDTTLKTNQAGKLSLAMTPDNKSVADEDIRLYADPVLHATPLIAGTVQETGFNVAHDNRMPYLPLVVCISIGGIFPSRP